MSISMAPMSFPGFWNMHTHLTALLPHNHALDGASSGSKVIRAGVNAMEGLRHGFTALRSVGEEDYIDVTWQRAFDQGYAMGPRIFPSGQPVSPTAGHRGSTVDGADGVAAVRKAVRSRIQNGVSTIKIHNVEMLPDELAAVVETAHSLGVHVTAHTREPAAWAAVEAGVDSLEHGYGLTDKTIELMAQMGTFYDPTIICNLSDEYIKEREARLASLGYSEDEQAVRLRTLIAYADERSPEHALYQRQALVKAAEAGVKLLIGSDSMPIGEIGWLEMEQFVLSGCQRDGHVDRGDAQRRRHDGAPRRARYCRGRQARRPRGIGGKTRSRTSPTFARYRWCSRTAFRSTWSRLPAPCDFMTTSTRPGFYRGSWANPRPLLVSPEKTIRTPNSSRGYARGSAAGRPEHGSDLSDSRPRPLSPLR